MSKKLQCHLEKAVPHAKYRICLALVINTLDSHFAEPNPRYLCKTTNGEFTIELYMDQMPLTAANFMDLADSGPHCLTSTPNTYLIHSPSKGAATWYSLSLVNGFHLHGNRGRTFSKKCVAQKRILEPTYVGPFRFFATSHRVPMPLPSPDPLPAPRRETLPRNKCI